MANYIWDQSAGRMTLNGKLIGNGYAGRGDGKNNPAMQDAVAVGPIPRGLWRMTAVKDSPNTGPFSIVLEPEPGTDARGRSAFRVHGDSVRLPGTASHGCITLPRAIRQQMWAGPVRVIEVVE